MKVALLRHFIWTWRNLYKWLFYAPWTVSCVQLLHSEAELRADIQNLTNEALHVLNGDAWAADVMRGDWVWWEVNHRWYLPQSSAAALPAGASWCHRRRPAEGAREPLPAAKEASGRLPLTHAVLTRECMETCTKALSRLHFWTLRAYLLPAEQLNVALWSE